MRQLKYPTCLYYCIISTIVLTYDNNLKMNVLLVVLLRIEKTNSQVLVSIRTEEICGN